MPTNIEKITEEQTARMPEWVDKWVKIGLSTEPADFDKAEAAVRRAYEVCGLKQPKLILRMGSPLALVYGGPLAVRVQGLLGDPALCEMFSRTIQGAMLSGPENKNHVEIIDQLRAFLAEKVRLKVTMEGHGNALNGEIRYGAMREKAKKARHVLENVGETIKQLFWARLPEVDFKVAPRTEEDFKDLLVHYMGQASPQTLRDSLANLYQGQFWASWAAYISFFRDVMEWENPLLERFTIDEDLVTSCGYVWWHKDVAIISDRPSLIKRDDQHRLHNEVGPSIAYRDGWEHWHWHGVMIPREWITDKASLTPSVALQWRDIEQRRVACEIVGWDNILDQLSGKTINANKDPEIGTLVEVTLPDSGKERFLRVKCGTGRRFAIPVPPTIRTALEANAWIYDIDTKLLRQKEYRT